MSATASPRGKRTQPAAEATLVDENVEQPKRAKPRAAPKKRSGAKNETRKRAEPRAASGKRPTTTKPRQRATASPPVEPAPVPPVRRRRHRRLLVAAAVLVLAAAAALLFARENEPSSADAGSAAVLVSPARLLELAAARPAPIYWAGSLPSTRLELHTTSAGTYVRYLPTGSSAGSDELATTVATYPLRNAYEIAVDRGATPEMTSRRLVGGGIAVWRGAAALSVYVAFQGEPHLIEVYAPEAGEARRLAVSGRIKAVD